MLQGSEGSDWNILSRLFATLDVLGSGLVDIGVSVVDIVEAVELLLGNITAEDVSLHTRMLLVYTQCVIEIGAYLNEPRHLFERPPSMLFGRNREDCNNGDHISLNTLPHMLVAMLTHIELF